MPSTVWYAGDSHNRLDTNTMSDDCNAASVNMSRHWEHMWGHQTNICKFTSLNPSQVPVSFSQGASSRFSKNSSQDTPTFIGIILILFMNKEGWNYIISPFEILIFREWYNWIMLTSLELTNPNKNLVSFEYSRLCVTIRRGLTIRRFSKLIRDKIWGFL